MHNNNEPAGIGSAAVAVADEHRYPIRFTGLTGEYFRIWIVNLALTVVTLGIYSAWAKVRKKRYFYGNTLLNGEPFDYRGDPVAILKGRAIAAALFALYYVVSHFYPLFFIPLLIALGLAIPWLVCRSYAFNAYNSAWRNIRFHFTGRYPEALKNIVGIALLIPLTLGLLYPYYKMRQLRFLFSHHRYGTTPFTVVTRAGKFYRVYLAAVGLFFVLTVLYGAGMAMSKGLGAFLPAPEGDGFGAELRVLLVALPLYAAYLFVYCYLRARVTNLLWNNLTIGPASFESSLGTRTLFMLYLVNVLAILATLGLATPWAAIRSARYRAERTTVLASEPLEIFAAEVGADVSATGEAMSEMFDIDIGL